MCLKKFPGLAETSGRIHNIFVNKLVHARFAVVFCRWKELNLSKYGQLAFCTTLKAHASVKSTSGISKSNKKVELSQSSTKKKKKGSGSSGKKKREVVPFSNEATKNRNRRRGLLDILQRYNSEKHREKD